MANSPRMNWPYPSEKQYLWYEAFQSFIDAIDGSGYAAREDRGLVLSGGGTVLWLASSSQLSWSQPIQIFSPITGFLLSIPARTVTLEAGRILYATLVRAPTRGQDIEVMVGSQVPPNDTDILLAVRIGDLLYWRNGQMLRDGESADTLGGGGGGGGAGSYLKFGPHSYAQAAIPVEEVMAQFVFDGGLVGSSDLFFKATLTPLFSGPGVAEVRLYDLGPAGGPFGPSTLISSLQRVANGLMTVEQALTTGAGPAPNQLAESERAYELDVYQSSVMGDTVFVGSAGLAVV